MPEMKEKIEIRNHQIEDFLQCPFKRMLKSQGWVGRETSPPLIIGSAVHAMLEKWTIEKDEVNAVVAANVHLEGQEQEIIDTAYAVFLGYIDTYKNDTMVVISNETEFSVPLTDDIDYGMRIDGLVEDHDGVWVAERKTTDKLPGNFWKRYQFDRQTMGYVWGAKKKFSSVDIVGVMVDAMFKPNSRRPQPIFERQFFRYTPKRLEDWYVSTCEIGRRMTSGEFPYKSGKCITGWNSLCEFIGHCSEEDEDLAILQSTHEIRK